MMRSLRDRLVPRVAEPAHREALRRDPLSELILARTPAALVDYPLETLFSIWALYTGLPLVFCLDPAPTSITSLVDSAVVWLWAVGMTISGVAIAWGILFGRNAQRISRGLWLLGPVCLCYAIALFNVPGGRLLASFFAFVIAPFCLLRGALIRAEVTMKRRVRKATW